MKKSTFGMGYISFDENVFPKVGFIGYQFSDRQKKDRLVKLQLFKSDKGWAVVNVLANDKIHQAKPTYTHKTDHVRSKRSGKAKVVAAKESEAWFNQQGIISNVRSTSISCYMTKDSSKASCHKIYGLKKDDKALCFSKSYLMEREQDVWKIAKEISYDQKVSYSSGELKTTKPFSMRCS
jgi:superfamily II helicase